MSKSVSISDARKLLPTLFDRVTAHDGQRVVIRRRDDVSEAVLVSRAYLERLELAANGRRDGSPFRLVGSGTVSGDVNETIAAIRSDDAVVSASRLAEFAGSPRRRRAG